MELEAKYAELEAKVVKEPIYSLYKVEYEWTGDSETLYWTRSEKEAKGWKEWLEKKYPNHKVTIKSITKISVCEEQKL